jgi:hypothetical protein
LDEKRGATLRQLRASLAVLSAQSTESLRSSWEDESEPGGEYENENEWESDVSWQPVSANGQALQQPLNKFCAVKKGSEKTSVCMADRQ